MKLIFLRYLERLSAYFHLSGEPEDGNRFLQLEVGCASLNCSTNASTFILRRFVVSKKSNVVSYCSSSSAHIINLLSPLPHMC